MRRLTERLTGHPVEREPAARWPELESALHTALDTEFERPAAPVAAFEGRTPRTLPRASARLLRSA